MRTSVINMPAVAPQMLCSCQGMSNNNMSSSPTRRSRALWLRASNMWLDRHFEHLGHLRRIELERRMAASPATAPASRESR